ncbi:MAG: putative dsRNA-binding protein, partial [Eubacterium sp.]
VMGAVFLDSDYDTTKKVFLNTLDKNIELALSGGLIKDYKTELQEQLQKHNDHVIEYVLEKSEGPEHNKTFFIRLQFNGDTVSTGTGKSKKEAEQDAAKNYLFKHKKA